MLQIYGWVLVISKKGCCSLVMFDKERDVYIFCDYYIMDNNAISYCFIFYFLIDTKYRSEIFQMLYKVNEIESEK